MNQKKRYRLGIIGIGVIAETQMLPAVAAVDGYDIIGAYDASRERLEYISKTYSIPGASSLDELFAKKCDAVYIATPNCDHVPLAVEALRNNVAVLLEKPCADTLEAAERLAGEAVQSSRPLLIAYMHKWNRHNQKAKQLVLEGRIGELRSFSASFGFFNDDQNIWRLFRKMSGPGALADLGIYPISTALDIFGEMPVSCSATAYPAGSSEYGDEFLSGRLSFSDGRWMHIATSFLSDSCGYTMIGTKGAIHVEGSWAQSGEGEIILCTGRDVEVIKEEVVNPYEQELICLKNCLDGMPVPSFMSVESAVKDISVMSSLDSSAARNGEDVKIKLF